MLEFVLKYFFLIGLVLGAVNYLLVRLSMKKYIAANPVCKDELEGFVKKLVLICFGSLVILGVLELLSGMYHPFFMLTQNYSNLAVLVAQLYIVFIMGYNVYWVIGKGGAELMAKYNRVVGYFGSNEVMIKAVMFIITLAGLCLLLTGMTMNIVAYIPL